MKTQKEERALRILEALSGVDEELLERCGEPTAVANEGTTTGVSGKAKVYRFARRYGGLCAACLCMVLVSSVYFKVMQPKGSSSFGAANDAARPETVEMFEVQDDTLTTEGTMQKTEAAPEEAPAEKEMEEGSFDEEEQGVVEAEVETAAGCPVDSRVLLTEQEARETALLGEYIPAKLFGGYVFEEARGTVAEGGQYESISVSWSRGLDTIFWSISQVGQSEIVCVDVEETDKYDVHRYSIPYADSVPEEYREVFHEPVFRAEDLSSEVIERRMKSVQDAGDTDTPRGTFSVLFKEGILVRFNGRGTAAEIWELFKALPE